MGPYQVLPFRVSVDLGAMAMKGYSAFPKAPALLEPHYQTVLCHIQDTRWGGLTLLQRCSRCILQPQPTGQRICGVHSKITLCCNFLIFLCFYVCVKNLIHIKFFSTYGYLEVINGFLVKFWPIVWFMIFFWQICNVQSKCQWNSQFNCVLCMSLLN